MSTEKIQSRIEQHQLLGQQVCARLRDTLSGIGFDEKLAPDIQLAEANFDLEKDPFSGEETLHGKWFSEKNQLLGSILFHADGSFFAEYDIVKPHPGDTRWFVEAITAWGRGDVIKSEPRLLPVISD